MPEAARVGDMTQHSPPLNPGIGSPDVMIGFMPAWRALPSGMGAGIEDAANTMKDLMSAPKLDIGSTPAKLAKVFSGLMQDSAKAAANGAPGAPATTSSGFTTVMTTNVALTATYTAAAAIPGGEPAAGVAYTEGIKAAAAAFASAAMAAIAGVTDTHVCPIPCPIPPHGPGVVTKGSKSVFINKLPAARKDDKVFEACGGADPIAMGCMTVIIGDDGGGPASGGPGSGTAETDSEAQEQQQQAQSMESALSEAAQTGSPLIEIQSQCGGIEPPNTPGPVTTWVKVHLIDDDTGEPFRNIPMRLRLPDGTTDVYTTDSNGYVIIEDIEQPGVVAIEEVMDEKALEVRRVDSGPA